MIEERKVNSKKYNRSQKKVRVLDDVQTLIKNFRMDH